MVFFPIFIVHQKGKSIWEIDKCVFLSLVKGCVECSGKILKLERWGIMGSRVPSIQGVVSWNGKSGTAMPMKIKVNKKNVIAYMFNR